MGESFGLWQMGLDKNIMPYIDRANIACGFHASDPDVMAKTVKLAVKHKVIIGAHPGYNDKQGFGRRPIPHSLNEIKHLISYQIGALQSICQLYGAQVDYIKPHGALYHDMMNNLNVFKTIIETIHSINPKLSLVLLAKSNMNSYQQIANKYQINLQYEVFADRQYSANGDLVPRSENNAVLENEADILNQVKNLAKGYITSQDGKNISIKADTVCVHGDNLAAVNLIEKISKILI